MTYYNNTHQRYSLVCMNESCVTTVLYNWKPENYVLMTTFISNDFVTVSLSLPLVISTFNMLSGVDSFILSCISV